MIEMYKLGLDGSYFLTQHFSDVQATIDNSDEEYTISKVRMTQKEYEKLPEFDGFN